MESRAHASLLRTAGLTAAAVFLLAACSKHAGTQAQTAPPPPPSGGAPQASAEQPPAILSQPLNQLLAPIALYPDPLIALILPASVNDEQLSQAASYLSNGGDPDNTQSQPWDDSVRSLAHYPQLVQWLAQNSAWTQQLGSAFASDPAAVMSAIQALRAAAQNSGALTSTPQQVVTQEDGTIAIDPASDDQIYAPSYDPNLVYADGLYGYNGPFLAFSDPWPSGVWLDFGFDWNTRSLWYGDARYWRPGGRASNFGHGAPPAGVHTWRPSRAPSPQHFYAPAAPQPMRGSPPPPHRWSAASSYPQGHPEDPTRPPVPADVGHPSPAPDTRDHGPYGERVEPSPHDGRPPSPGIERRDVPHPSDPHHEPERRSSAPEGNRDRDRRD